MLRVVFVGNSVPLRVRPPAGQPFPAIVEQILRNNGIADIQCFNESKGATLITDGIRQMDNQIISKTPSFVIINYGINEASTRLLPKRIEDWIYWKSILYLTPLEKMLSRVTTFVRKGLNFIRPSIIRCLRLGGWASANYFEQALVFYIQQIIKETQAHIILLTIPEVPDQIEKLIPGTSKRVKMFNEAIECAAQRTGCMLLDINSLFLPEQQMLYYPEGIHFNQDGHMKVANALCDAILNLINREKNVK